MSVTIQVVGETGIAFPTMGMTILALSAISGSSYELGWSNMEHQGSFHSVLLASRSLITG